MKRVLEQASYVTTRISNGQPSDPGIASGIVGYLGKSKRLRLQLGADLLAVFISIRLGGLIDQITVDGGENGLITRQGLLDTVDVQGDDVTGVRRVFEAGPHCRFGSHAELGTGECKQSLPSCSLRA